MSAYSPTNFSQPPRPTPMRSFDAVTALGQLGRQISDNGVQLSYRGRQLPHEDIEAALSDAGELQALNPEYFQSWEHLLNFLRLRAYWNAIDRSRRWQTRCFRSLRSSDLLHLASPQGAKAILVDSAVLTRCLSQLPVVEGLALWGRYHHGMTDEELGEWLCGGGSKPARILRGFRLRHRALNELRRLLKSEADA